MQYFEDRPSASDLYAFEPVVDESLEEPLSPEDEEMLAVLSPDPMTVEEPTERHLLWVKRLYALGA